MDATRRATLAGLGAAAVVGGPAQAAALPRTVQRHPGFRPWKQVFDPEPVPLDAKVTLVDGQTAPLGLWLGRGPTVLVLWAHWCAPCRAEKPAQAALQRRLTYLKSSTKIKCVQAFDSTPLSVARATLDRTNAKELETARATPEFEQAILSFFGPSVNDPRRVPLPSLVLLDGQGVELGRAKGTLASLGGQTYWGDAITQQFLGTLDRLLQQA